MIRPHSYDSYCGCRACAQVERRDDEADELQATLLDSPHVLNESAGELSDEQWQKLARFLAEGDDLAFCNMVRQHVAGYVDDLVDEKVDQMSCDRKEAVVALMDAYEVKARKPQGTPELPWRAVA